MRRPILLLLATLSSCHIVAGLGDVDEVNDGNAGSGGGIGGNENTSGSNSANSSSLVSSTASTASGTTCDTGEAGELDFGAQPCGNCAGCALNGPCAAAAAECPLWSTGNATGTNCDGYIACAQGCTPQCDTQCAAECSGGSGGGGGSGLVCDMCTTDCNDACVGVGDTPAAGSCGADYADGLSDYVSAISCIVCQECPNNCDGVNQCSGGVFDPLQMN